MKWHLCRGGYHKWPESLKRYAARCCCEKARAVTNIPVAPASYVPQYLCSSGRHVWSQSIDALRCCNGCVPIWQTLGDAATKENPFEVRQKVLVPTEMVTDMDEHASQAAELRHLFWPM